MTIAVLLTNVCLQILLSVTETSAVSWENWWTYDGISGPAFWGLINPDWSLCSNGKRQSPINLEPSKLLFDPNLTPISIDKHRVDGELENTGHSVIFTVHNSSANYINVTGGPLSYKYKFHQIHIHYGTHINYGSEHTIHGHSFPAEIQIYGFNSQLYSNFTEALLKSQGVVGISLLVQSGDLSNPELRILTDQLDKVRFGGSKAEVKRISVMDLLPDTEYYMTYDGSYTMPACWETVTWIIMNRPIYITKQQLHLLRRMMQGNSTAPKAPLGNNYRLTQKMHNRLQRTNIDFNVKKQEVGTDYELLDFHPDPDFICFEREIEAKEITYIYQLGWI